MSCQAQKVLRVLAYCERERERERETEREIADLRGNQRKTLLERKTLKNLDLLGFSET